MYEKPKTDSCVTEAVNANDATFVKSPAATGIDSPINSPVLLSPSVDETNVFERIVLDCCDEIMCDFDAHNNRIVGVYKQPLALAFYKPPNRLLCMQQYVLKRIFKLFNGSLGNGTTKSHQQVGASTIRLPSQVAQLTYNNRRKRDAVDEILIQELYEDEARWTNFDLEEEEIRNSVTDLKTLLADDSSVQEETNTNATTTATE